MPRTVRALLWCACCLGLMACQPKPGGEAIPQAIRINVFCSTCDNFLRCQSDGSEYTLYRLRGKTVWGQIATIWDYLIARVRPKQFDHRPLTVYGAAGDQKYILEDQLKATLDLQAATVRLPDALIDMRDGVWFSAAGVSQGQCELISNRDGYRFVRELLGRALPTDDML